MAKSRVKIAISVVASIFAIIFLLIVGGIFIIKIQLTPRDYELNTTFTVERGAYGKAVFDDLEEQGIIRNSTLSYYYMKFFSDVPIDFKAGTFELDNRMSLEELVTALSDDTKFYRPTNVFTIIEGKTVAATAKAVAEVTNLSEEELIDYWNDETVIRGYMADYPFITEDMFNPDIKFILEGYLFPSTYEVYEDSSLDEITRKFLDTTLAVYDRHLDEFENAPSFYHFYDKEVKQMTTHEVFTFASILQWESGSHKDMKDIASVFYNRFKYPDRLGSSVTACYSQNYLDDSDACRLLDYDMSISHAEDGLTYNTNVKYDLPIGPITNPGEDAIVATLNPNDTDYFYFVGANGQTYFATVKEGNEGLINKYLK